MAVVPTLAASAVDVAKSDLTVGEKLILEAAGADRPVTRLWPGDGARDDDPLTDVEEQQGSTKRGVMRISHVTRPSMIAFLPEKPNGQTVIVFPGGGYGILAADLEGVEIAKWLNGLGIAAFVVKYRVPRRDGLDKHAVALQDAQRAIRLVRSQEKQYGIDPDRIGVLGFSAGGHLAALSCHRHRQPSYANVDEHDTVSCRPDFGVLIYPAYTTVAKDAAELDPLLSQQDRKDAQPIFMTIAADDSFMPGAMQYMLALREWKTPVECHVYPKGGHGQGLRETGYPFSEWTKPCERWLTDLDAPVVK